jgi:hypothetical protein
MTIGYAPYAYTHDVPIVRPLSGDEDAVSAFQRKMAIWGGMGVALGGLTTGIITAFAFSSFKKRKSALAPALIVGGGNALVGAILLAAAIRGIAIAKPNEKLVSLTIGTKLAT